MIEPLRYETVIDLGLIPVQWIPRFEIFMQDLPNFPLIYVHLNNKGSRIFGFPVSANFVDHQDGSCRAQVRFLSNKDICAYNELKDTVRAEISERFGLADPVRRQDIIDSCNGNQEYVLFFSRIWDEVIAPHHGGIIPYGAYYEKFYSIIRFVAAWNTAGRGGRQQEMRQVYWFLREYGERVDVQISGCGFYLFYLLPTFEEIKSRALGDFPKIASLLEVIEKIWDLEFTESHSIGGRYVRSMKKGGSWPPTRDKFVRYLSDGHVRNGRLTNSDAHQLGLLVDMFDRFPPRAAGFIWCVMSIFTLDFESWDRNFLDKFYISCLDDQKTIGVYPKVVACFLQQGFRNTEAIPMDSWILSFVRHPLGIFGSQYKMNSSKKEQIIWEHLEFFGKFKSRAKLERLIWLVSQSKKVNMEPVFNMIWCIRYGTTGDRGELRQQNPISCYKCELRNVCKGYLDIQNDTILIHHGTIDDNVRVAANNYGCKIICGTANMVPKKVEKLLGSRKSKKWVYVDEFSGLRMNPSETTTLYGTHTVAELIKDLERQKTGQNTP